ncbi:MAG: HEAT repeat domain-containing protein [Bryobacteraceae bacterium]|jgi:HEAT repeat protein
MMLLRPDVRDLVAREDTPTLVRATRHWQARIRGEAAAALGALRTGNAVPELLRLLNDSQTEVREAAARALGDIGRTEAVDPLIAALGGLKSLRNDRPGSKEYEFEAIAEALGKLNSSKGVAAVIESGTVRFHEGSFSISRPHVSGLCLSGGTEARAALARIIAEHYLYETYSLIGIVEALDYLHEARATAALIEILNAFVELLKKPWLPSNDPFEGSIRNVEALALSTVRALGRLQTRRAEAVLIDLLLHVPTGSPTHSSPSDRDSPVSDNGDGDRTFPHVSQLFADTQNAILTIRGDKSPAEFDCERASLRLRDYQARRYKTDVEFGGRKRWATDADAAEV